MSDFKFCSLATIENMAGDALDNNIYNFNKIDNPNLKRNLIFNMNLFNEQLELEGVPHYSLPFHFNENRGATFDASKMKTVKKILDAKLQKQKDLMQGFLDTFGEDIETAKTEEGGDYRMAKLVTKRVEDLLNLLYEKTTNQNTNTTSQKSLVKTEQELKEEKIQELSNTRQLKRWIANRKTLLSKFENDLHVYRRDNKHENVSRLQGHITILKKQIEDLEKIEARVVSKSAKEEIDSMTELLNKLNENPSEAGSTLDIEKFSQRLKTLNYFFLGKDPNTGVYKADAYSESINGTVKEFCDAFEQQLIKEYSDEGNDQTGIDELKNLKLSLIELGDKFSSLQEKVVVELLKKNIENQKGVFDSINGFSEEALKDIVEKLIAGNIDIQKFNRFTPLSDAGILGQMLDSIVTTARVKERGKTISEFLKFEKHYKEVAKKKDSNTGIPYASLFFGTTNLGVKSGLYQPYNLDFLQELKEISILRKNFRKNAKAHNVGNIAYKDYIERKKKTVDYIDVRFLKQAWNLYGKNPLYRNFFKGNTSEEIERNCDQYEKHLREKFGDTFVDIKIEEALEKLKDFVEERNFGSYKDDLDSEYTQSPFETLNHYESENATEEGKNGYQSFSFLVPVPKNDSGLNKDFRYRFDKLENGKLGKAYKSLYKMLTTYINPAFATDGADFDLFALKEIDDAYANDVIQSASLSTKMLNFAKETRYRSGFSYYSNKHSVNKNRKDLQTDETSAIQENESSRKNLSLGGYIKGDFSEFLRAKDTNKLLSMAKKSPNIKNTLLDRLVKMANDEKIPYYTEKQLRQDLVTSLAQEHINTRSSLNMIEIINTSLVMAQQIRVRDTVKGSYSVLKNYAKTLDKQNISQYLEDWFKTNIEMKSLHSDNKESGLNKTKNAISETAGNSISALGRKKTVLEKDLLGVLTDPKEIQERYDSIKKLGNSFYYKGSKYAFKKKTKDDPTEYFYAQDSEDNITTFATDEEMKEFRDIFDNYMYEKMKRVGTGASVASITAGLASNTAIVSLAWNYMSGIANRSAGRMEIYTAAASGTRGYSISDVRDAEFFLKGYNTNTVTGYTKNSNKGKNFETLFLLLDQLQVFQNVVDGTLADSKDAYSKSMEMYKNASMFFAVSAPEAKNQATVALAILKNVQVDTNQKDEDGNTITKPFFDGKNFIYEPGTLKLKPEFDTEKNRALWENFDSFQQDMQIKEGEDNKNVVEKKKTFETPFVVIKRIKSEIKYTQGNYAKDDVAPGMDNLMANVFGVFKKYMPAVMNNAFGETSVNLELGKLDSKGRMRVLFEHGPTATLFLTVQKGSKFLMPFSAAAIAGIPSLLTGGATILGIGGMLFLGKKINARLNKNKNEVKKSINEMHLMVIAIREILLRTADMTASRFTGNRVRPFEQKFLKEQKERSDGTQKPMLKDAKIMSANLDLPEEDRVALLELFQRLSVQMSNTVFMVAGINLGYTMLRALLLSLGAGGDDDDDDKKKEEKSYSKTFLDNFMNLEGVVNKLYNLLDNMNQGDPIDILDIGKSYDNFVKIAIFQKVTDMENGLKTIWNVANKSKPLDDKAWKSILKGSPIPIPNYLMKAVLKEESIINDDKNYNGETISSTFYKNGNTFNPNEKVLKKSYLKLRAVAKQKYYTKMYNEIQDKYPDKEDTDVSRESSSKTERWMGKHNKKRKEEYSEAYARWKDIVENNKYEDEQNKY